MERRNNKNRCGVTTNEFLFFFLFKLNMKLIKNVLKSKGGKKKNKMREREIEQICALVQRGYFID